LAVLNLKRYCFRRKKYSPVTSSTKSTTRNNFFLNIDIFKCSPSPAVSLVVVLCGLTYNNTTPTKVFNLFWVDG
jgi:hypothetical protein